MLIYCASFDIGKINFSFYIEEFDVSKLININHTIQYNKDGTIKNESIPIIKDIYKNGKTILHKNYNLITLKENKKIINKTKINKKIDNDLKKNIEIFLDQYLKNYLKKKINLDIEKNINNLYKKKINEILNEFYKIYILNNKLKKDIDYNNFNNIHTYNISFEDLKIHVYDIFKLRLNKKIEKEFLLFLKKSI